MPTPPAELLDTLHDRIRRAVAAGFDPPDVIEVEAAESVADDSDFPLLDLLPTTERLTAAAVTAHLYGQAGWPDITDCDRLDAAFADLEVDGIIARHHFTCCSTCGHAEIGDEIAETATTGSPVRGYTFYHMQDTEAALEGDGVYLKFGAVAPDDIGRRGDEAAATAVAAQIVAMLTAHGLQPEWNGSASRSVFVPLDWKRRRPAVVGP